MSDPLRAELARCAALPETAPMGMPGAFYAAPDWFAWECEHLLRDQWHCLGRTDEIPNPGDFLTATVLDEPVLVVRTDTGEIAALSNVCRHRGMPLATGQGTAKRFVCSYHAWAYGLDGALLRAPRMVNAGFDAAACALPRFALRQWQGFIHVCVGTPPAVALDALDDLLAPFDPTGFDHVHSAEEEWRCNWKCLVENFMEGYHLSVVHPETLHPYTPTGLSRKGPSGPGFTSYFANYPNSAAPRGQGAPGLSDEQRRRSTLFALFPAQVASQAASLLVSLALMPLAADRTRVRWTMSARPGDLDGATIAQRIALWDEVNREDRLKLEAMQAGLGSRHFPGGPLAGPDHEGTVRDFQTWLAGQAALTGDPAPA